METYDDEEEVAMCMSNAALIIQRRRYRRRRRRPWGGSLPGKGANRARDFAGRFLRFKQLYLGQNPVYSAEQFRRRFRMRRELFSRIVDTMRAHDECFEQKRDCTGKLGIHPIMKVTAALRMLAYGCSADSLEDP